MLQELNELTEKSAVLAQRGEKTALYEIADKAHSMYSSNSQDVNVAEIFSTLLFNLRIFTFTSKDESAFLKFFQWQKDLFEKYPRVFDIVTESLLYYSFHTRLCAELGKDTVPTANDLISSHDRYDLDLPDDVLTDFSAALVNVCYDLSEYPQRYNQNVIVLSQAITSVYQRITDKMDARPFTNMDDYCRFSQNAAKSMNYIMLLLLKVGREEDAMQMVRVIRHYYMECNTTDAAISYTQALQNYHIYSISNGYINGAMESKSALIELVNKHPQVNRLDGLRSILYP